MQFFAILYLLNFKLLPGTACLFAVCCTVSCGLVLLFRNKNRNTEEQLAYADYYKREEVQQMELVCFYLTYCTVFSVASYASLVLVHLHDPLTHD